MEDKTEDVFLQCLHSSTAESNSPPSGLSRFRASPARHLWHYFHLWSLVQTLGRGVSAEFSALPSFGRGQVEPPPISSFFKSGRIYRIIAFLQTDHSFFILAGRDQIIFLVIFQTAIKSQKSNEMNWTLTLPFSERKPDFRNI